MSESKKTPAQEPIAIIGMACIYPGAGDLQQYWKNITQGVDAISDVPGHRWDKVFYDPDSNEADRFYCKRGGFVDDYTDFDPVLYGIMPKAAQASDPDQLLSLKVGVEALQDAGYLQISGKQLTTCKEFDKENTGVIIGRGNYLSAGTLRLEQRVRQVQQTLETLKDLLPDISTRQLQAVKTQLQDKLDYYGPDTAVGLIPNLVASRLANRLDLHGPAYTVDAACASSLIALEQACDSLRSGRSNMMLAGGLHFTHDLTFWATFCQLGALSRSEKISPFSEDADGIIAGEGIGMLVLKRKSDAERDGDRIYALVDGVASASDGKSSSLLAPAVEGQLLSLQRAWQQCDFLPQDIGLLEAHGTGTPAGDNAELETIKQFFGSAKDDSDASNRAGLGSVKSMIGHTMPAAGVAGIIKVALALHHRVLPPTLHCEKPQPALAETRFRILQKCEEWKQSGQRLAAVNAFGFGGINAHAVLSSHSDSDKSHESDEAIDLKQVLPQVVLLQAGSQQELLDKLEKQQWDKLPVTGLTAAVWRLVIISPNDKKLAMAKKIVSKGESWSGRSQIYFSAKGLIAQGGKIAFLFPGVDSTFEPRADDLAAYFNLPLADNCRRLDPASELLKVGLGLTAFNKMLFDIMGRLGITADAMAGHSIGEWCAMAASGMLSQDLVDQVMQDMSSGSIEVPDVQFLAASCSYKDGEMALSGLSDIVLSHDNCPHQVIFCGKAESIQACQKILQEQQILAQVLPFSSGFHTPLFKDYIEPYRKFFTETALQQPAINLWSATTAASYPDKEKSKQTLAVEHLLKPVLFRPLIENMYAAGYRVFLQMGTGSLLGFVDDTLKGKAHLSMASNIAKRSGLEQLQHLSAALWVEGGELDTSFLSVDSSAEQQDRQGATQPISPSSIKLRLGVPLLKLDEPLAEINKLVPIKTAVDLQAGASVSATQQNYRGSGSALLDQAFESTLSDIQQSREEITDLWDSFVVGRKQSARIQKKPTGIAPFNKVVQQHMDLQKNIPWVMDHAFYPQKEGWPVVADKHPVIPLTMELMILKELAEEHFPALKAIAIEDVHAFNWLIVETPVDLNIHLNFQSLPYVDIEIEGYVKGRVKLAEKYPTPPTYKAYDLKGLRPAEVTAKQLYDDHWMFHGSAYQGVIELGPIADNGIRGRLQTPKGKGSLLDNMGQLAGYFVMEQDKDSLAMPIGIDKINFYADPSAVGECFDSEVKIQKLNDDECFSDLQLVDDRQQVRVSIDGWKTRRFKMDRRFWLQSKQADTRLLSEEVSDGVLLFHDRYETAITRDYMQKRYLAVPEREAFATVSLRRRRNWLNGRIAAKDACRHFLWQQKDQVFSVYPKEICVLSDEHGAPHLNNNVSEILQQNLCVSIAHKDRYAIARVSDKPIGVDIESIEVRSEEFVQLSFSTEEQSVLERLLKGTQRDEVLTRCWSAKECVAKQGGKGLEGSPKKFSVTAIDNEKIQINEQWVQTQKYDNYIIAWTL